MADLTKDTPLIQELGNVNELPVKASSKIFEGAAVGIDASTGHARHLVAGDRFAGFAESQADNSAGLGAAINVRVIEAGAVEIAVASLAATDVGKPVYASDSGAFTLTQGANSFVGAVKRFVASGIGVVGFDARDGGALTVLTAATGTGSDTIADVGAAFSQITLNNNFKSLADKVNAILRLLK